MNFYNDNDPKVCAWTRELVAAGLIPDGVVDCRSITDIQPHELNGYTQCHFFCGIAGWPYALGLAGWPVDRPVWTASLPCQPFSAAGEGRGEGDDRHLWPVFARLARECRPQCIIGEQVARAVGFQWLDAVSADLEAEGYAVGAAVLGAHSAGAPHVRQRLYWVADLERQRRQEPGQHRENTGSHPQEAFRETDRLVDAVRREALPFLCGSHDGIPESVGRVAVKGFGNAIVPQVAAEFIAAFMEPQP